jgi:hypothetical protein
LLTTTPGICQNYHTQGESADFDLSNTLLPTVKTGDPVPGGGFLLAD